ncbi:MAG: ABC transporter substrate-binding protein [Bacteroidetes bacterium]|nr:ABC transporter substrate-binding protein [Bacteroidota bacterium]
MQSKCGTTKNNKQIKDYYNRSINIPQNVERIIPLYYVQAEIICAIGAKEKIVGIGKINERSSLFLNTYFPEMLKLPQVGQAILIMKNNFFKTRYCFYRNRKTSYRTTRAIRYLAIATYPKNLKDIMDETLFYGSVMGKSKNQQRFMNYLNLLKIKS